MSILTSEETQKEYLTVVTTQEGVEEGTPAGLILHLGCAAEYAEFASDVLMIHEYFIPNPTNLLRALILLYNSPNFVPRGFELAPEENAANKKLLYRVCTSTYFSTSPIRIVSVTSFDCGCKRVTKNWLATHNGSQFSLNSKPNSPTRIINSCWKPPGITSHPSSKNSSNSLRNLRRSWRKIQAHHR